MGRQRSVDDAGEGLKDNFETRCEICGATLAAAEISEARELGRAFLCSLHAAELLPAEEQADEEGPGA
jgi:hypothetical protein